LIGRLRRRRVLLSPIGALLHVRDASLLRDGAGMTDEQLLDSFIHQRDQAAFAVLVRRHGGMVGFRRTLGHRSLQRKLFRASGPPFPLFDKPRQLA
jgi:hypothetical protein